MLGNSVSDSISKTMDRAGVPGKPHSLRHWFGSTLKDAGVDSLVIKELMGHESLATTAIYVRVPLRMQCTAVNLLPALRSGPDRWNACRLPVPGHRLLEFHRKNPQRNHRWYDLDWSFTRESMLFKSWRTGGVGLRSVTGNDRRRPQLNPKGIIVCHLYGGLPAEWQQRAHLESLWRAAGAGKPAVGAAPAPIHSPISLE